MIRKPLLSFFILLVTGYAANAQRRAPVKDTLQHQQSVQVNAGSQGFGAAYNYGVIPQLALRLGFDIVPYSQNNVLHFSDFNSTSDLKAKFTNIHLLADYTPFTSSSWFRLVGGFAYFVKAKGTLDVKPADNYKYGDLQLTPDQVGKVTFSADWQGVAPYLGVGFIKMFPSNRFNVNLDLGTYYLNKPDAQIVGTGALSGNSSQTSQFEENIKGYRWLPVVQINFNYKL